MAININPGTPLRHVATFNSSGNWTAPIGTNLAFVSVVGAGQGGYGSASGNSSGPGANGTGYAGGVCGAYVQVTGGGTHVVTIGAGGAGAGAVGGSNITAGAQGGTTIFDGRIQMTGSGGNSGGRYSIGSQNGAAASGATTLTTINPGANTLVSTGTITSQTSGGGAGGAGANASTRYSPRYASGNTSGSTGGSGAVHIYI